MTDQIAKFKANIAIGGEDDCWLWTAGCFDSGYGAFRFNGKTRRAHRVAYEVFVGLIPEGKMLLHSCDNPKCCNPKHLSPGLNIDNIADRDRKGRQARGAGNGRAVLSDSDVLAIRADSRAQRTIARQYGVCKSTIGYIKSGILWSHI